MPEEGSERELEEFLAGTGVFSPERAEEIEEPTGEVVHDAPPDEQETPPDPSQPAASPEEKPVEEQPDEQEAEEEGDPHVVWATKKFGSEPERWAKAAYEREQHISRMAEGLKQAEEAAAQAINYAREVEANANANTGMPMSAAEEAWVERSVENPVQYAYQAAMSGNPGLYNAVIQNLAEIDPGMAANVGTQVQLAMHQERTRLEAEAAARSNGQPARSLETDLSESFARHGIDVNKYGQAMWEFIDSQGEYGEYALAIMGGDPIQRDIAVKAVYDLVRTGQTTTQRVADTQREEQIRREGELRRNAAGVVTGSPHVEPVKQSDFMQAMEDEWKRRGQWYDEEK